MDERSWRIWDQYVNQAPSEFIEYAHIRDERSLKEAIDAYVLDLPDIFDDPSLDCDSAKDPVRRAMWRILRDALMDEDVFLDSYS